MVAIQMLRVSWFTDLPRGNSEKQNKYEHCKSRMNIEGGKGLRYRTPAGQDTARAGCSYGSSSAQMRNGKEQIDIISGDRVVGTAVEIQILYLLC